MSYGFPFKLRFPEADIRQIAERYSYGDDDVLQRIGASARVKGFLSTNELWQLSRWKAPRSSWLISQNAPEEVEDATRRALAADEERDRIELLSNHLWGVSYPMASVILHACHREPYPILDYRALWSVSIERRSSYTFRFWHAYTLFCRDLARRAGVSMRMLDRALWQYSKEKQPAC